MAEKGIPDMSQRRRADVGPMSLRWRCDVAPTSGRCRCDGAATSGRCRFCCVGADVAATSLRRRADVEGHSRHVAATSGRCRADVAAMALRRRSDVGPMSLRCRCDGAATSLRRRCNGAATSLRCRRDGAATALRRRSDFAAAKYVHAHSHKDVTPCTEGGRKHEGLSFMMMEELGISSRRVTHGENASVKYHQLVGHYRCCISLATVKLRHVDRQSVLYSPLVFVYTFIHKYQLLLHTCVLLCHSIETRRSLRTPL